MTLPRTATKLTPPLASVSHRSRQITAVQRRTSTYRTKKPGVGEDTEHGISSVRIRLHAAHPARRRRQRSRSRRARRLQHERRRRQQQGEPAAEVLEPALGRPGVPHGGRAHRRRLQAEERLRQGRIPPGPVGQLHADLLDRGRGEHGPRRQLRRRHAGVPVRVAGQDRLRGRPARLVEEERHLRRLPPGPRRHAEDQERLRGGPLQPRHAPVLVPQGPAREGRRRRRPPRGTSSRPPARR